MRQSGVSTAQRSRGARAWVDFGVDETWERAAPRRTRASEARPEMPVTAVRAIADAPSTRVVRAPDTASETATAWSHVSAVSTPAPRPGADAGVPGRRTVTIRGRGAERDLAFPTQRSPRRPPTRPHERPGFKPDRAALWAIMLGVFLVLVAATSSHAATLRHAAGAHNPSLARPAALVVRVSAAPRR